MSLTSESMSPADIAAVTGNNTGAWGNEGGAYWLLILFLFCFMGWGGGSWGGNHGNPGGPTPYQTAAVTQSDMQRGFDQQAVIGHLDNLTSAVSNGFANAEISRCNQMQNFQNTITNLGYHQQAQADQTQQSIADVKYTIATEGCADRNALSQAMQNLEISLNSKVQSVLDKMCQQEIEQKNDEIAQLRQQLYAANLTASQVAQTGRINDNTAAQIAGAVNQLRQPAPVPAYVVPNPYGCNCGTNYGWCGVT